MPTAHHVRQDTSDSKQSTRYILSYSGVVEGVYITDTRAEAVAVMKGISGKVQCGRCKKAGNYHLDKIER